MFKKILSIFNRIDKIPKKRKVINIPNNQSIVRTLLKETGKFNYQSVRSLEEAKEFDNAYVVLEGDYGGQIYLVAPVRLINCSQEDLKKLLTQIDRIAWPSNNGEGANIYFERYNKNSVIPGGMGGGHAGDGIWVHPGLQNHRSRIIDTLAGKK